MSTSGQKDDLVRQVALLESYCAANGSLGLSISVCAD
ncbi:hypothetical protein [Ferrimicrobium acidiphilum]